MKPLETLLSRVLHFAEAAPQKTALCTDGGAVRSYAWLADQVRRRAAAMVTAEVRPGTRFVMAARRDEDYIITLLAGWYVGAAPVPLPCDLSVEAERALTRQLGTYVDFRGPVEPAFPGIDASTLATHAIHANDEAYVMFTSGSTGVPKGVRIAHRGLPPLFKEQARLFRTTAASRTSWMLAPHFDASISDIGVALWSGATLVIWPGSSQGMLDFVVAQQLTQIDLPPSKLPALVQRGLPPALETIIVGGEPTDPSALREAARQVRVVNVYGPTETTVCASVQVIDPGEHQDAASIGHPLAGVGFHVDEQELYISGPGVALGYLDGGRGAFVDLPGGGPHAYRTGDLVDALPDGSFLYLGRRDRQVQLRGKRLELAEVEAALLAAPGVGAAAAVFLQAPAPRVVAFIEAPPGAADVAAAAAIRQLQAWKRPADIRALAALPRLGNGKVDLVQLHRFASGDAPVVETDPCELDPLAAAWCQTLGTTDASDDDDFFLLGGDSVTALELSIEAARAGLAIEPEAVFSSPRLGDLRTALTQGRSVTELRHDAAQAFSRLRLAGLQQAPGARGVLLTGATGMLGLALLRSGELSHLTVFALVRGKDQPHATERLRRLMGGELPNHVRVLRGNLGLDHVGLSEAALALLSGAISDVIHGAGAVDLVRSYASLRPVHVDGTGRAMEVAARLGARLHHVSTLSIFVESDLPPGTVDEGLVLAGERTIFGGYAQSKFVGDALARQYPLGGNVIRLGLLTADDGCPGARPPLDQLSRVVRGVAALGSWPVDADARAFDVTPVESAARLLARLVVAPVDEANGDPPGAMAMVHLANPWPVTGAELRAAIAAAGLDLDLTVPWPPPADLDCDIGSAPADPADRAVALAALTARAHRPGQQSADVSMGPRSGDLFLATDHRFACDTVVSRFPDTLPPKTTPAHLQQLVHIALGTVHAEESAP